MAGTRSSSRISAQPSSSPNQDSPKTAAGTKRKPEPGSTPKAKRGRKSSEKEQKTIEDTLNRNEEEKSFEKEHGNGNSDVSMKEANTNAIPNDHENEDPLEADGGTKSEEIDNADESKEPSANGKIQDPEALSEEDPNGHAQAQKSNTAKESSRDNNLDAGVDDAVEPREREDETPSSILEKGIIYFFFRGRVGIDEPQDVNDIARSYMVMRPLPHGAKLGEGSIGDAGNCRLLALPKKVLPTSHKDRFMIFVEKAEMSFADLKENFLSSTDYDTKTAGTRHSPAATPVGEGVYAITTTGRESHLAYILTIPNNLSEVQKDVGLRERGSFFISTKNPQHAGPANTNLPQGPDFPKEILDEFRTLRWAPTQPKHLDFANAQFLLIGESQGELGKAVEQQPKDEKQDKETPLEEMEKLEGEDKLRVEHLKGDDAIFADLGLSSKDYPKMQTTW